MGGASVLAILAGTSAQSQADLVGFWTFDALGNGRVIDSRSGVAGVPLGGAALTPTGGGRTGGANDRAMRFGIATQRVHVATGAFLAPAAAADALSVSFWVKETTIRNSTSISIVQPAAVGTRGFQAHVPWSDNVIYFDTGGCCDGTNRTNTTANTGTVWTNWHHVALIKNGSAKEIWLDGVLKATGTNTATLTSGFSELFIGNGSNLGEGLNGDIDDMAFFSHGLTAAEVAALAAGGSPFDAGTPNDTDADGLPDMWELSIFPGDLTQLAAAPADKDSDGLPDAGEYAGGLSPIIADSDADGLPDGVESNTGVWVSASSTGTNPLIADTDSDGLKDGVESNTGVFVSAANTGTNPHLKDTDGDLIQDGPEVIYGASPVSNSTNSLTTGVPMLLAWWKFDNDSDAATAVDSYANLTGTITGAAYTADMGGATGAAGDKALNFTAASQRMKVDSAQWLNIGGQLDKMSFSFWQKLTTTSPGASVFWGVSPTAAGERGIQAHNPFSNNNIYFDSGDAVVPGTRINGVPPVSHVWTNWHHYAFVKNGLIKQVYIDGVLVLSGNASTPLLKDFTTLFIGSDAGPNSIRGTVDDFSVFGGALSAQQVGQLFARTKTPPQIGSNADTDGDGLTDVWETLYFPGDLTKLSAAGDFDTDGLPDLAEAAAGTDPNDSDSDNDLIVDGFENGTGTWTSASATGTKALVPDSDGDGLLDGYETNTGIFVSLTNTGSNPNILDTDNDGVRDRLESMYGSNPSNAAIRPFQTGQTFLLAHWPFNDNANPAVALDVVAGHSGAVAGLYSDDALGHTGQPGDRAMSIDPAIANSMVNVADAAFLNMASTFGDAVTISFWQKLDAVRGSSAFWGFSPSSGGVRGIQAHAPWSDNTIYFDHAGCCAANQRLSGPAPGVNMTQWHHFAFVKKGASKQVWIDGLLVLNGTVAAVLPSDFTNFRIGSGESGGIDGLIDDFAIYAGGLTPDEIIRLATGESPATIPQWPAAPYIITSIADKQDGSKDVTWNSRPGRVYTVQASTDLTVWTSLQTGIPSGGSTTTVTLPGPFAERVFFRVLN